MINLLFVVFFCLLYLILYFTKSCCFHPFSIVERNKVQLRNCQDIMESLFLEVLFELYISSELRSMKSIFRHICKGRIVLTSYTRVDPND